MSRPIPWGVLPCSEFDIDRTIEGMSDAPLSISDASAGAARGDIGTAHHAVRDGTEFEFPALSYGDLVATSQVGYRNRLTERLDEIARVSDAVVDLVERVLADARSADRCH